MSPSQTAQLPSTSKTEKLVQKVPSLPVLYIYLRGIIHKIPRTRTLFLLLSIGYPPAYYVRQFLHVFRK